MYKQKDIFVEFDQDKFIEILEKYYKEFKSIKKAMEAVASDLKKEVVKK